MDLHLVDILWHLSSEQDRPKYSSCYLKADLRFALRDGILFLQQYIYSTLQNAPDIFLKKVTWNHKPGKTRTINSVIGESSLCLIVVCSFAGKKWRFVLLKSGFLCGDGTLASLENQTFPYNRLEGFVVHLYWSNSVPTQFKTVIMGLILVLILLGILENLFDIDYN